VQTVVFTSSGTWTAPLNVVGEQIIDLFIKGGEYGQTPGQFLYTTGNFNFAFYSLQGTSQPGSQAAAYTYAQAGAIADSVLASLNSGGTGERDVSFTQILNNYNPNTGGFYDQPTGYAQRIRGTATPASGPWDNRSSEIVRGIGNGWYFGVDVYYPPEVTNGTPSSAFGYTVQGGTVNNPTPIQNFGTNSIIPGQTYQIIVGSPSGFVTFRFVQGD